MRKDHRGLEEFIHLSDAEAANPNLIVDDFFRSNTLPESRKLLWDWLKVLTGDDFDQFEECDQDKMLRFFEDLEKLVEAAYIINSRNTSF